MSSAQISLVVTTIYDGAVLESYCRQAELEEVKEELIIIVIPDRKSPVELFRKCAELGERGFKLLCPTISEQNRFLKKLGFPINLIPYDSDNRRNIGYLMALKEAGETIISIDDDNYCMGAENTFRDYAIVTEDEITLRAHYTENGWINFIESLEINPDVDVYPRGYPYNKRRKGYGHFAVEETVPVRLNVGLWVGEPDLDAMTWLVSPVQVKTFMARSFLLGKDMWSPINTQNTSLHRDLMVSYYYVKMGAGIDRFGDIFSGYFCQKCMQHMGDRVRVGTPIAVHDRNRHNYLDDLAKEIKGVLILEDLVEWLREIKLNGTTYGETYLCLADKLDIQIPQFEGFVWTKGIERYFKQVTNCMREWVKICQLIG